MKYLWLLLPLLLLGCAAPSRTEGWCLPKRVTRTLALMFTLAFGATFSNAAGNLRADKDCERTADTCSVVAEDLFDLIDNNNNKGWEIAHGLRDKVIELRKQIADMKAAGPKCAEVEITEPSKNAPKKLPKIPHERDT